MRIEEVYRLIESPEDGTFAGAKLSGKSIDKLYKFVQKNNIPNPVERKDYHSTILFSRVPLKNYKPAGIYKPPLTGKAIGVKMLGKEKDSLVVLLDSPDLVKRHERLMKENPEATWDFPEFIPHVTLAYDVEGFDPSPLNATTIGELEFVEEYTEDIDPDWN